MGEARAPVGGRATRGGRTPLFAEVKRLLGLARQANAPGAAGAGELAERERDRLQSRREFLGATAVAGAGAAGLLRPTRARAEDRPRGPARPGLHGPRIAIVGAGMAGLSAAYRLKGAGLHATVYSAEERLGGRMLSATGLLAPGVVTELGGEFIDSNHVHMRSLAAEFDVPLLDLLGAGEADLRFAYFFGGAHHTEAQVIEAFRPLARRIAADLDLLDFPIAFDALNDDAARLDRLSLRQYLDEHAGDGLVRALLDVAYVGDYGLETAEQSALNLLGQINPDTAGGFQLYGESDQRYKVAGGNHRLIRELAARLEGQVRGGHVLEAIRPRGSAYALTFRQPGGPGRVVEADVVILAIPFTTLRQVDIAVPLPEVKRRAIRELGYGTNAKVVLGFHRRSWRDRGYNGLSYSDLPFQSTNDNGEGQHAAGPQGGLTAFLGGAAGLRSGEGTAREQARRHLPGLDRLYPGVAAQFNGRVGRAFWPGEPFVKGSYACYKVGQYAGIAGAEGRPVGRLLFAGEHCSLNFQGFMEGAAETGQAAADAARALLAARV